MDNLIKNFGWTAIKGIGGTYTHKKTGAAMVVYVGHIMLLSAPKDTGALLCALGKDVDYKDPAAPMARYLGALYKFDAFNSKTPNAPRSMLTSMDDYAANAAQRFVNEYGKNFPKVLQKTTASLARSLAGSRPALPATSRPCYS